MQDTSSTMPLYIIPILVIGVWCLVCVSSSFFGGWHKLSKRFSTTSQPYGDTKTVGPFFYTVYLRFWGKYSSLIRITSSADALYFSVILPFRIGHPPLCIPWSEIKFNRTKFFFRRYIVLTLGEQEQIPMRIRERMARNLGILERVPQDI